MRAPYPRWDEEQGGKPLCMGSLLRLLPSTGLLQLPAGQRPDASSLPGTERRGDPSMVAMPPQGRSRAVLGAPHPTLPARTGQERFRGRTGRRPERSTERKGPTASCPAHRETFIAGLRHGNAAPSGEKKNATGKIEAHQTGSGEGKRLLLPRTLPWPQA